MHINKTIMYVLMILLNIWRALPRDISPMRTNSCNKGIRLGHGWAMSGPWSRLVWPLAGLEVQ